MKQFILAVFFLIFTHLNVNSQNIGEKDTIYITQCDTGSQGKIGIDLDQLKNSVFSGSGKAISPTVYISTAAGGIIKIMDINTNPTIQNVCNLSGFSWTDIAINKDKQLYLNTSSSIHKVDTINCTAQTFYTNTSQYLVALSFDTKNNLYFSDKTSIYRFNNTSGSPVLWKDFGSGTASGDFVMKNDKMYISWQNGGAVDLYEVNVDNNINYISHINKCRLKTKTYGLASELGQLYGVTPTELYKIDEVNCKYTTVITNNTGFSWYGAAGFHEAQNSATVHLNYSDAISISNPMEGKWTNTIPYQQIIYITIKDKLKDSLFIYPIKITIVPVKKVFISNTICRGQRFDGYSASGIYTNIYKSSLGCDSIHTVNLSVVDTVYHSINVHICQGESYKTYTSSGIYKETYKSSANCDSILTIDLVISPQSFLTINKTICAGKSFLGKTIGGTYIDTFLNKKGCDSIRTLNLSVITRPKPIIDKNACIIIPNQFFWFYNQKISSPGIFIDSTNHMEDCDTIYRLHVVQQIPRSEKVRTTQCHGFLFKGVALSKDTTTIDTILSALGCDSLYRQLSIHIQKLYPTLPTIQYYCDTFIFKNNVYASDSFFIDTLRYKFPPYCDSVRQRYIYRKAPRPEVSIYSPSGDYLVHGESMNLSAKGAETYQWNTGERNSSIRIQPEKTGKYSVQGWNSFQCSDSAEISIEVEDFVHFDLPKAFSPNGDGENDLWQPNSSGKYKIINMEIFNRWGEKVFSSKNQNYSWDGYYHGQAQNPDIYIYYILVEKNRRLFERKGSFTLVK